MFTKKFVREHLEVFFIRVDKGNVTIALNKNQYIEKMESMLSDKNTYKIIKRNPTLRLTNELRTLLTRWKNTQLIDGTYRRLMHSDGILPKTYGLPKIHKQKHPLRIIISTVKSTLQFRLFFTSFNKG